MKFIIFAALLCFAQANVLLQTKQTLEVDEQKTEEWLRIFYDNCGRTWNIDGNQGSYIGDEMVKKCVGDRDGCIENRDCVFAVAMTETASYSKGLLTTTTPGPGTTQEPSDPFDKWERHTTAVDITLLDACHLEALPVGDTTANKFVGLAFGVFDEVTGNLACDSFNTHFSFENVRVYFAVNNFTHCNVQPNMPVHPYFGVNTGSGSVPDPITNEISITPSLWRTTCNTINDTLKGTQFSAETPDDVYITHLLAYHYGTAGYTDLSKMTFINNDPETRENVRFLPKDRMIDQGPVADGSTVIHGTALMYLAFIFPFIKYFA